MGTRDCNSISAIASPSIGEAGRTGDWRTSRPVVEHEKCLAEQKGGKACFLCWLYCPEAVIPRTIPIHIDLEYCKGCGICAVECPTDAIIMVEERIG
ncbi:MAG: 4Fe-4S binding protein [Dehalococcoidia bacterium]|nr:4Fe-4S binding protein [Dehalococcoidia bacterium]